MKKAIRIILLLAVIGGGAYWWWTTQAGKNTNHILVSGNLELQQVDVSFKIAGKLVERPVTEGDLRQERPVTGTPGSVAASAAGIAR